jgi:hypothetical protein
VLGGERADGLAFRTGIDFAECCWVEWITSTALIHPLSCHPKFVVPKVSPLTFDRCCPPSLPHPIPADIPVLASIAAIVAWPRGVASEAAGSVAPGVFSPRWLLRRRMAGGLPVRGEV